MRISHQLRAGLIGLIAIAGASLSSAAYADSGTVQFSVLKAGWFIGGSGGSGVLTFHGRRYPVSIGGLSAGLVFGASETHFVGTVSNIFRPSDVAGVYGAAGAGAAIVGGAGAILLTNEKGAVLSLSGRQIGLIANVDLSGMAISLR
jgi:lipid-binding SYLF domain-containing protein